MTSSATVERKLAKRLKNARLRATAGLRYVTDPTNPTLEKLHMDERFSKVSLKTLERWSREDRWMEQRQAFIARWTEQARERLGSRMAQERIAELDLLDDMRQMGLERLHESTTIPKSTEGMMKAILDIMKYKDELRTKIGGEIVGSVGSGRGLPTTEPENVNPQNLAEIATQALAQRRHEMRASLNSGAPLPQSESSEIESGFDEGPDEAERDGV